MHLTGREIEKLLLHQAGELAAKRLKRGVKLNYPESVAYICSEVMEQARDGKRSVEELMDWGTKLLKRNQVMEGIPEIVSEIQVECLFPDGNKLVSINNPIR